MSINEILYGERFFTFEFHLSEQNYSRTTLDSYLSTDSDGLAYFVFENLWEKVALIDDESLILVGRPDSWPWCESFPEIEEFLGIFREIKLSHGFVYFFAVGRCLVILRCELESPRFIFF
jgi:hypothetical protein